MLALLRLVPTRSPGGSGSGNYAPIPAAATTEAASIAGRAVDAPSVRDHSDKDGKQTLRRLEVLQKKHGFTLHRPATGPFVGPRQSVVGQSWRRRQAAPIDCGDVWTWTAICEDTKPLASFYVGDRIYQFRLHSSGAEGHAGNSRWRYRPAVGNGRPGRDA